MGLDQFVRLGVKDTPKVDAAYECVIDPRDDFFYWRKHANLQGFITDLYVKHGGGRTQWGSMTGAYRLDAEDIDAIEKATIDGTLPHTTGFFFGESSPEKDERTLEFCKLAREALARGEVLIYESSW